MTHFASARLRTQSLSMLPQLRATVGLSYLSREVTTLRHLASVAATEHLLIRAGVRLSTQRESNLTRARCRGSPFEERVEKLWVTQHIVNHRASVMAAAVHSEDRPAHLEHKTLASRQLCTCQTELWIFATVLHPPQKHHSMYQSAAPLTLPEMSLQCNDHLVLFPEAPRFSGRHLCSVFARFKVQERQLLRDQRW